DALNGKWTVKCIGCAIVSKEVTPIGGLIKETQNFVLHQDPEIPIKNFLIIAAKKHIKSIVELSTEQNVELFDLCYKARKALLSFKDITDCKLIQEEQSGHFHLWILPRYGWMNEKFDNSLTFVRPIMKYARENHKTQDNLNEIVTSVERLRKIMN
ncbi:MAG: HIT family hydrolase, partial [Oscillospiraceae bacterium]|nr:HIT family hydrolase [Oscillospiraceae bacterium]